MSLKKIDSSELYNNIIDKVTIIVSEVRKMAVTCKFRTHVQSYHNEMTDLILLRKVTICKYNETSQHLFFFFLILI